MSDSDDESGGGLGLDAFLWGNIGDNDEVEADYLDKGLLKGALKALKRGKDKVGAADELARLATDRAGSSTATAVADAPPSAVDYADEPTLPEDLEDVPDVRPQQRPPAAVLTAVAAAGAVGRHVAGEDDYDDDDDMPDAPAAAAAAAILPQGLPTAAALAAYSHQAAAEDDYDADSAAAVGLSLQQQQQQLPNSYLTALHQQQQQVPAAAAAAVGAFSQALTSPLEPAAAAAPAPPAAAAALTREQQQELALVRPTPLQEARQAYLNFYYLDVDDYAEDIVHFSELFAPSETALRTACMDAAGKSAEQQQEALNKARDRSERHRQQQNLRIAAAQNQQAAAAAADLDQQQQQQHPGLMQGLMPDVAEGDESSFAVSDVDMLKVAAMSIKDRDEVLSDAEEELYISRGGIGRALIRAAHFNATAAAAAKHTATADQPAAAAAAGSASSAQSADSDVAEDLLVNPDGLEALEAGILEDWEMNIVWGDEQQLQPARDRKPTAGVAPVEQDNNMAGSGYQMQQQQLVQQQQQHTQLAGQLPGAGSVLPGAAPVLPGAGSGLPGSGSALPGFGSVLPGAGSVVPGSTFGVGATAITPVASVGPDAAQPAAAAAAAAGEAPVAPDGINTEGQPKGSLLGQNSVNAVDAADAAAAAATGAAAKAVGRRGSKHGRGRAMEAAVHLGKPKRDHHTVLAHMQVDKHMLRLITPAEAAALAAAAPAAASDAAALAAAAAGDRATAAALAPARAWGGAASAYRQPVMQGDQQQQQYVDAVVSEQLKLRHVPDLLSQEFKSVLPDDDEWLGQIIWDRESNPAAAAAADQAVDRSAAATSKPDHATLDRDQQQQQQQQPGGLVAVQQYEGGLSGALKGRVKVLWDLNDPYMVFQANNTAQFSNATAVVQQAPQKVAKLPPPHLLGIQDPLLHDLAPLHISCDHLYTTNEAKAGRTTGTGKHTQMAVQFSNNLLPLFTNDAFTAFWHRPRHWWSAANVLFQLMRRQEQRDAATGGRKGKGLKFEAVSLTLRKGKAATADDDEMDLADVWQVVSSVKSFKDASLVEMPRLFGPGPDFQARGWMGEWLDVDKSLKSLGFSPGMNYMVPVWSNVQPLKTAAVGGLLTPDLPSRPPAAFKTLKSLSVHTPGHILLLEYMEERPLMLLQPGMGIRITTYYRRKNDSDMHYQALQAWYSEGLLARQALPLTSQDRLDTRPPWMVGTPQLLTPDDPSPFFELAPIPPGDMQYAVDTPCFRAPAAPHVGSASDFLLVRSPAGALALREVTGCVAVGQQHPSMAVWAPMSQEAQAYERNRFKAYVIRLLRTRADKPNVKAGKAVASVTLTELMNAFQSMSIAVAGREHMAKLLREECFCGAIPDKPDHWTFVTGAKIPTETDLRKEVTPDQAVQYEALLAGIGQRIVYNLNDTSDIIARALDASGGPPMQTLRLMVDMLLPDEAGKQAASAIEQCVMNPPWAQSASYSAALRESRNPTALQLVGRGDPTARGRGFSYMREEIKKAKEETAAVKAKDDGTVQGTDADLRRLGHKHAGELLMTKFNMSAEEVNALPRWDRIDVIRRNVRDPKWSAVVSGDPELQQFVRNVKMSVEDQKAKMRTTAQPIFAAQMNALLEPWEDEALSDEISWGVAPALKQQQQNAEALTDTAASGAQATEAPNAAADGGGVAGVDGAAASGAAPSGGGDRGPVSGLAALQPGQELDLGISYHGQKPVIVRGRQEAIPGERRIRRTTLYNTGNAAVVKRTLLITNRDDISILNTLHKRGDGFGEQWIKGKPGQKPRVGRNMMFGMPWEPVQLEPDPDSLLPPEHTAAPPQHTAQAAAATSQWASGNYGAAATAAAGGSTGDYNAAAGATGLTAEQQAAAEAAAAEELAKAEAWRIRADAAAAAATAIATGRPVKTSGGGGRGLSKKDAAKAAAKVAAAAAAARKGQKKRGRRRIDDFSGSDDSDITISDDSELEAELEDMADDDSPTAPRQKRPRAATSTLPSPAAAAAPAPTAAASGAGGGDFGGAGAGLMADTAPGAMEGASKRLAECLAELKLRFIAVVDGMLRHQASKARMGPQFVRLFEVPVNPKGVPDYAKFVPPEKQMWLLKIKARVQRCYYGSVAEFLADCQALVDAAAAYNTIGRGGLLATPGVVAKARGVFEEGQRLLKVQRDDNSLDYWCKRVEIERQRQQAPDAFRSLLKSALQQSAQAGGDAPLGWSWYACDSCGQWRLLTDMAGYEMGIWMVEEAKFVCAENADRPGWASCQEPAEWVG